MSSLLDLVEADFSDQGDLISDGDTVEEDDDISDEEDDTNKDPNEPRKPRRAEIDPDTMTPEEQELMRQRVITQVEFYFGDQHYPNDLFLLEKAKLDPESYIDLKFIMAFKKMRRLTAFPAFVTRCLQGSTVVGVSADGERLRRLQPVGAWFFFSPIHASGSQEFGGRPDADGACRAHSCCRDPPVTDSRPLSHS
jgi:hypothetical protein